MSDFFTANLSESDPVISNAIDDEVRRQADGLELIASENFVSEAVLQAAGSDLEHVIQMTIYVSDIELWGRVNETYARVMGEHRPVRAIVPVKELHFGTLIEIQAIAAVKQGD